MTEGNGTGEVRDTSPGEAESVVEFIDAAEVDLEPEVVVPEAPENDELAERTADLQRLTAEYANYRRRVERDRVTVVDNAKASVVTELLGVLDDLDRARAHGDLTTGPLKSVADKLSDALTKQGVVEFGAEGESFDPTLHEAVQHEGDGHDPVIGAVLRKGYRLGDRVLRHALVAVTDAVPDRASGVDAEVSEGRAAGSAPDDAEQ
jgi:molecular chaperone GrpE